MLSVPRTLRLTQIVVVAGAPHGETGERLDRGQPNLARSNHMKSLIPLLIAALIATPTLAQEKKSSAKMEPGAAVRATEESWEAAIQKRDFKTIGDLIAPDFAGVSEENKLTTRSSLLARAKKDLDTYTSTNIKGLKVHVYGPSTVVAIGDSLEKGTSKDGKPFDRTYRFTDTWVNRNGQWQCVAEQVTQTAGSRP